VTPASDPAGGARARYLEVAVDLATRADRGAFGPPLIASAVSLHEVARGLGRPRTAMYRLWETQQAFWCDLTEYLVVANDYAPADETMPWRVGVEAARTPREVASEVLETFRLVANFVQDVVFDDVWVLLRAASLGYHDYPRVVALRADVEVRRINDMARTIEGIAASVERGFLGPLSAFDVAALVWAVADGLAVIHAVMPEIDDMTVPIDDGNGPQPWKLLGFACRAIIDQATTHVGGGHADGGHPPVVVDEPVPPPTRWSDEQQEVLALATRIFVERFRAGGSAEISAYGDLTIHRLAREAGVSRRAIYNVWPSVTDLRLDLLVSLLHGRARAHRDVLSRLTRPESFGSLITALLAPPPSTTVAPGHAALAFLVDLNNHAVREVFATASRGLIDETRVWIAANRPPSDGGRRVPDDALAVLVIALAAGANRLRRTCPAAEVRPHGAVTTVEAFSTLSLDGSHSPAT